MKTIIDAAVQNNVKRIIVTSSFANIGGTAHKRDTGVKTYDETDFTPFKAADGYGKSKIAQE